jgi:arylsulfatase A-like enzyme
MRFVALVLLSATLAMAVDKPNIIVIITDDQGYGDLSCHGHPSLKTPNLDKLHATSVRLTDFHACPMCTPTRGQLLSGKDTLRNKAMNVSSGRAMLGRGVVTLADRFAAGGYRCGQFGKWHLGDNYPYRPHDRGFHEALWFPSSHIGSVPDAWNNDYFNDTYRHNGEHKKYPGYCTDVFFRESIHWMKARAEKKEPFFCYLATNAPHGPLFADPKDRAKFADAFPPDQAKFFGMLSNIDDNIGALELFLRESGLRDNTIMVFLTDNGGTIGVPVYNAGMRGKKTDLYDGGHRVPCFVRWPDGKLKPGQDLPGLTTVQDLAPTLCELAGVSAKADEFDGISLVSALRGGVVPDRKVVIQFSRMDKPRPTKGDACVLWKSWRLIQDKELYDIAADPMQKQNVIDKHPDVAKALRAYYAEWWVGVEKGVNDFEHVVVGSKHENPTLLSSCEWADVFVDQGSQIRAGVKKNGTWHIEVAETGDYELTLRRWPEEANMPIANGLPKVEHTTGTFPEGVSLPVAKATLAVGDERETKNVAKEDTAVTYTKTLRAGKTTLRTAFSDADGKELCGAYLVTVRKK